MQHYETLLDFKSECSVNCEREPNKDVLRHLARLRGSYNCVLAYLEK